MKDSKTIVACLRSPPRPAEDGDESMGRGGACLRTGRGRFGAVGGPRRNRGRRFDLGRWASGRAGRSRDQQGRGSLIGGWLFLLVLSIGAYFASRHPPPEKPVTGELHGAAAASDGDSLRLAGRRVRIEGIDAPEIGQSCRRRKDDWDCGAEARRQLASLVDATTTRCRLHGRDRYGRDLGICESGGRDIGRAMVLSGLAVSYGLYRAEEEAARERRAGLWSGDFVRPQEWRRTNGRPAETPHRADDWLELIARWIENEVRTVAERIIGDG
ncbi:exopolysaccharide biosynthesis protein [Ensifer sp. LCM 4579]|nr:thermonuclease family protein [Ensifer sp. LCM 4579]OHV77802.1 exopolysaccharide biosynthesis protein [Ensifer sp. LCM 4579]